MIIRRNPNDEDGEYKQAIGLLYGIAFTIKMSKKGDHQIDGYLDSFNKHVKAVIFRKYQNITALTLK